MTDATPPVPTGPVNPLDTADPAALVALFEVDPAGLAGKDFDGLIMELRRRADTVKSEKAAQEAGLIKPKRVSTKKKPVESLEQAALADKPIAEISVDDLFGDE